MHYIKFLFTNVKQNITSKALNNSDSSKNEMKNRPLNMELLSKIQDHLWSQEKYNPCIACFGFKLLKSSKNLNDYCPRKTTTLYAHLHRVCGTRRVQPISTNQD